MRAEKLIPEIYLKGSRDFTLIAKLFEVILNYMQSSSKLVASNLNTESINSNLLDLLCNTLGFIVKHKYKTKDLLYITNIFSLLLKNKGTIQSIELAVNALLSSQEINKTFEVYTSDSDFTKENKIRIFLPESLEDIVLLDDIFEYILPVGTLYEYVTKYDMPNLENKYHPTDNGNQLLTYQSDEVLDNIYQNANSIKEGKEAYELGNTVNKSLTYTGSIYTGSNNNT